MAINLSKATLRELRFHLCQTGKESQGVRDFIKEHYVSIKKDNPSFPILIRECEGVKPVLWARFAKGIEVSTGLCGTSAEQILNLIKGFASKGVERRAPLTNMKAEDVLTTLKKLIN